MSITLNSSATNNADWKTVFEFSYDDTGEAIDFTGATLKIDVKDQRGTLLIDATTDNGLLSIVDIGRVEMSIPASAMESLCPGTYNIGGVCRVDGVPISLFTGTVTVIDGVARL